MVLRNRAVIFILIILILLPSLPKPSYGRGQVMEIDALFGDFKLQVEGRYFPHKETFIYDGELWVPMEDISRQLNLSYSFNIDKRLLNLNSNGRLNFNDVSKEPIVYQRGYEIQAKERRIAELEKEIQEFEGRNANSLKERDFIVRNIRVGFSDIDIYLDGTKIFLDREPLLYKGDVYVSLISLSPILFITPELKGNVVNIDGNTILVEKPKFDSVDKLLSFRENLNNRLDRQLQELEKKKKILMDVKIPYEKIASPKEMEKYLNRYLNYIEELSVTVNLSKNNNSWYYLDIEFERRDINKWQKLTRRDVEAYVWDILVAITSLYDEEAKIQGQIRNSNRPRYNYVEFNTHMRSLVFNFIDSGLDMTQKIDSQLIEDLLERRLYRYQGVYFDYSARISGYDLELTVYPSSKRFMENWSVHSQLSFLREIDYIIRDYYPELSINGLIEYPGRESIEFLIQDGKVRSPYLERKTEEFLKNKYGFFILGSLRIPMDYRLHSSNLDDYKLMVYMDFDINDERWNRSADDALGAFLHDLITEVISLWDINVFLEVYDKKQAMVKEIVISQDIVQMVTAEPGSGEIVEGSTVRLNTNTDGATIYYTLDGSAPSPSNRILYTGPIVINKDTIIRAYATKKGLKDSPISSFEYRVVEDSTIARGLDGLTIIGGRLKPEFDRRVYDYEVEVDYLVESISINARANTGSILINGEEVASEEDVEIDLEVGQNRITIIHKEEGKKDRIYTIIVRRKDMDSPEVWLDPNYTFNTSIVVIFKGRLASNTVKTFNGYEIELLSRAGNSFERTAVNPIDGSFEIVLSDVDIWDKLIGFKYRIYQNGVPLPEDEDGNILNPR